MKTVGPIIMIGFKGAGKSLIGRAVAKKLNMEYSDTDAVIEKLYTIFEGGKLTCREIHHKHGPDYFRKLEVEAIKEALQSAFSVVSFGGGALDTMDKAHINPEGAVFVYLDVEKDALFKRIMEGGVPAFFDSFDPRASFEKIYAERRPVYERYATVTANNTSREVGEVVDSIIGFVGNIPQADRVKMPTLKPDL